MVRAIGALLLIGGTAFWGLLGAARLSSHAGQLRGMVAALQVMQSEICTRLTPMEEVLRTVCWGTRGGVRCFFENVTAAFSRLEAETFSRIWTGAVENTPQLVLSRGEKQALIQLGQSLGRYDARQQREALAYAIGRFESFALRAETERREKARLNAFMGVAAGLFAVVILL